MTSDFDVAQCIERGDAKALEAWLAQGNRLDAPVGDRPVSALHLMARHESWAGWLARKGAVLARLGMDVDARAVGAALSPLSEACAAGRLPMARAMLALGADPDGAGGPQGGPLHFCPDRVEFLETLVSAGADINRPNQFGKTPLRQWVDNKHSLSFAAAALGLGADATLRCDLGETPLRIAMEMDLEGWARSLIKGGAKFEDLACIDPQTGELSADASTDGLPASLGLMLSRLASGPTDSRNRVILLLNLAGPEETELALRPNDDGGITPALEIAARKGHFQMAAKFIKSGARWTGSASDEATEPRPFSEMGVLGICLWHCLQADLPLEVAPHGKLAIYLAKKCASLPALWVELAEAASRFGFLGPVLATKASALFGQLRSVMEQEAIRLSLPTAVARAPVTPPRRRGGLRL